MQPSPYTPGAVSREVPGREQPLAEIEERLAYLSQLGRLVERIRVDYAPRGLGKTSMLREAQRRAESFDVLTLWVTVSRQSPVIAALLAEIERRTKHWDRSGALARTLEGVSVKLNLGIPGASGEISWSKPSPSTQHAARAFEEALSETVRLATLHGKRGVVLFLDEIQDADAQGLAVLFHAWQHLQSESPDLAAAVFADGLPDSKRVITEAVSPSERFHYRSLGPLSSDAVQIALAGPARDRGVTWSDEALAAAVEFCGGYPHSVQLVGDYTWRAAGYPAPGTEISVDQVRAGIAQAEDDLAESFDARLSRIKAERERHFVAAMASLGDGPIPRQAIADALGLSSGSISDLRQRLIHHGVIQEAGRGRMQFTAPGFAAFVREHFGIPDPVIPQRRADPDQP